MTRAAKPPSPARAQPEPRAIRVLLAEDHAVVRAGLRMLVDAQPGLEVVGEAADGLEAWQRTRDLRPDVAVLDLSMPGGGGIEAAARIRRDCPRVRVLVLTMHDERGYVSHALRAGATGYVLKQASTDELARAIRTVAAGRTYIDPSLAGALMVEPVSRQGRDHASREPRGLEALTAREGDVLRLLALGHIQKEIAATLEISVKTVETHKANAMARLGLQGRAALVRFAIDQGWLNGD